MKTRNSKFEVQNRPGIALIITLAAVGMAFVIGMAVISGLPAASRASANLVDRQAAIYLAESGLQEAIARVHQPPPGQTIWSGVTRRSVTGLSGTYDVIVTDLGSDLYRIDSVGHAVGSSSGSTISQNLHMIVSLTVQSGGYTMPAATVMGSGGFLSSSITYNGNVAVVGTVYNLGHIQGDLTASQYIFNFGYVDGNTKSNTPVEPPPNLNLDDIRQYSYNGQTYQAQIVQPSEVRYLNRNLSPITSSNPLGVIVVAGDMTLRSDINLSDGILVVRGDLNLGSYDIQINHSREDYFALMVGGNVGYQNNSQLIVNSGPAYIKGSFNASGSTYSSSFLFNAGLVSLQSLPLVFSGSMQINKPATQSNNNNSGSWGWGHYKKNDNSGSSGSVVINLLTGGGNTGGTGSSGRTVSLISYSASAQP